MHAFAVADPHTDLHDIIERGDLKWKGDDVLDDAHRQIIDEGIAHRQAHPQRIEQQVDDEDDAQPGNDAAAQRDARLSVKHHAVEEAGEHRIDHPARKPRSVGGDHIRQVNRDDAGQAVEKGTEEEAAGRRGERTEADGQHLREIS